MKHSLTTIFHFSKLLLVATKDLEIIQQCARFIIESKLAGSPLYFLITVYLDKCDFVCGRLVSSEEPKYYDICNRSNALRRELFIVVKRVI